ncbi:MAG: GNAT family N-acetyltransferase [Chitinophagaceae bacterium]|nr:GNAT family N-acetyltransferase [Chitinophagaceae bacterium]
MEIVNANKNDLPFIYKLFEEAIAFQKANNYIGWLNYDKIFLQKDVENLLLYKVVDNENILGIFSICLSDELIWRDKEKADAIYIHRIVLNRQFTGEKIFKHILNWAIAFAAKKQLSFVRMDTWAANKKLIDYYKSYGFQFVEDYTTADTEDLPIQHRNLNVALLQLHVDSSWKTEFHAIIKVAGEKK